MTLAASIIYPIIVFVFPPKQAEAVTTNVIAGKVGELVPNSGKIFKFGNKPGILINTPEGELRAFTAICTHLQCIVQYRSDFKHIWCACHNGHFDLFGKNIAGPPPRPLEQYKVNIVGEDIIVSKV
ncbi:MAG: ubiquinol-cytochrome c reductase iron-sulfur subunit [bacterium]